MTVAAGSNSALLTASAGGGEISAAQTASGKALPVWKGAVLLPPDFAGEVNLTVKFPTSGPTGPVQFSIAANDASATTTAKLPIVKAGN